MTEASAHTTLASLRELLREHGILADAGTTGANAAGGVPISGAACDSRQVRPGNAFFCKGAAFTPAYLVSAAKAGAAAYLCEPTRAAELASAAPGLPALITGDLRQAMALVSAKAWGHPDRALPQLGITGTKGKSTTAYMLRSILEAAHGEGSCGVIGSIDTYDGIERFESVNTTPEAPDLWRHLANARDAGLAAMVMEVSSQALKYERTLGLHLDVAAFLNIGRDHISPIEHPDFEDYFTSKLRIFEQCDTAVVNLGCEHVERVLDAVRTAQEHGAARRLVTFGVERPGADLWADGITPTGAGIDFTLHENAGQTRLHLGMPGLFNVENALAAIAMARALSSGKRSAAGRVPARADGRATVLSPTLLDGAIRRGLSRLRVPGRMELLQTPDKSITIIVDYAHNKLSYESLFASVEKEFPGQPVISLFGAPGDKALERRRELPQTAGPHSRLMIFAEEDPAHEDPAAICAQMAENVPQGCDFEIVVDREQAIARAFEVAQSLAGQGERPVVLLLAKGDETRQHRGDAFPAIKSDLALAREFVARQGGGGAR